MIVAPLQRVLVNYAGFPILGIEWQKMENPDLRKALGMKGIQKGVRIRRVEPTAPAYKYLQASDILLSFDAEDIANDGTGTNPSLNVIKSLMHS